MYSTCKTCVHYDASFRSCYIGIVDGPCAAYQTRPEILMEEQYKFIKAQQEKERRDAARNPPRSYVYKADSNDFDSGPSFYTGAQGYTRPRYTIPAGNSGTSSTNSEETESVGCVQALVCVLLRAVVLFASWFIVLMIIGVLASLTHSQALYGGGFISIAIWLCWSQLGKLFPKIAGVIQFALAGMMIISFPRLSSILLLFLSTLFSCLLLTYLYKLFIGVLRTLLKRFNISIFDTL